jgi:triacylglycerol lipase
MSTAWPDQAIMMTLSAIAYQSDIAGQLKNKTYATGGDWSLVWGPVQNDYGNLAFVVRSASTGNFALVIRGSLITFTWAALENWFYDLDVLLQSSWPYFPNASGAMVSNGTYWQAYGLASTTWGGQTLASFLMNFVPRSATLYVTGHSLGGNLATVLASWISALRGPAPGQQDPNTRPYTFAAPSPGNTVFASAYNARFPNSWRYWNVLDVVPNAWDNLPNIGSIYDDYGLYTPVAVLISVDSMYGALLASEAAYDSYYQQTNGNGTSIGTNWQMFVDWYTEVGFQHGHNTYLGLLGAPPVKDSLLPELTAEAIGPIMQRPKIEKGKVPPMVAPRRKAG